MLKRAKLLCLVVFCLLSNLLHAQTREIHCRVVNVSDGDTLTCLLERKQIKVRLLYIDAPESAQPFGNRAKQALSSMVFKRIVTLKSTGYDRYQRLLAEVFDERGRNVNLALVQQGMAWAYYQTKPIYHQAEQQARQQRRGLWQDKNPINPYEWRKQKSMTNAPLTTPDSRKSRATHAQSGVDCRVKLSCKQIGNYLLAQQYFQQCGWKELDGNNDGIPCNKLYRQYQAGK